MLLTVYFLLKACWMFDGDSSNYYVESRKDYAFWIVDSKPNMYNTFLCQSPKHPLSLRCSHNTNTR